MKIEDNKLCNGCGCCANVCSKSAIKMQEDEKGFLKPIIDKDLCINCGLCDKTCPIFNYGCHNVEIPNAFAVINNDEETRLKSSSGGVFSLFASKIINDGGVVFGVIYDEDMKVCHSKAETIEELEKMHGSKYVQSDLKFTYKEVKQYLEEGKKILFSGTPCQIAGLKSYIKKDYENLLSLEVLCHGIPSRKVFELYKKEFMQEKNDSGKILNINLRSKVNGWKPNLCTTTTTTTIYHEKAENDYFMRAFLSNLNINDSCLNCKFNTLPRVADITIGDFWGVDNYDKSLNDNKGTSIILINSGKGQESFDKIKCDCIYKSVPLNFVIKYNPNIISSSKPHRNRDKFFRGIAKGYTLESCINKYDRQYSKFWINIYKYLLPKWFQNIIKRFL